MFLNNNSLSSLLEAKQKHCPTNEEKLTWPVVLSGSVGKVAFENCYCFSKPSVTSHFPSLGKYFLGNRAVLLNLRGLSSSPTCLKVQCPTSAPFLTAGSQHLPLNSCLTKCCEYNLSEINGLISVLVDLFIKEPFDNKAIKPWVGLLAVICKVVHQVLWPPGNFLPRCLLCFCSRLCYVAQIHPVPSQDRCRLVPAYSSYISRKATGSYLLAADTACSNSFCLRAIVPDPSSAVTPVTAKTLSSVVPEMISQPHFIAIPSLFLAVNA